MKLRLGPVPVDPGFVPQEGKWVRLREPSFGWMMILALPLSLLLAFGISQAWGAVARAVGVGGEFGGRVTPGAALSYLLAFAAILFVHELFHAVALPHGGLSAATTLGFWPKTLTPYVCYEGELPRSRHIIVGLAPFVVLSIAPLLLGMFFSIVPLWAVIMGVVNAFGASGDLIGAGLLAFQAPSSALVRSKGLETWWRPADA